MTTSGRLHSSTRRTASASVRSYSARRGVKRLVQPAYRNSPTTCRPRNPPPPVTRIRLLRRSIGTLPPAARGRGAAGREATKRVPLSSEFRSLFTGFCRPEQPQPLRAARVHSHVLYAAGRGE